MPTVGFAIYDLEKARRTRRDSARPNKTISEALHGSCAGSTDVSARFGQLVRELAPFNKPTARTGVEPVHQP